MAVDKASERVISRLPPQSVETEEALIGALLHSTEPLHGIIDAVDVDDLYRESHRKIFSAILSLFERNEAIDLITLAEALKADGTLEAIGGAAYLSYLSDQAGPGPSLVSYAKIIREKAILRALIQASHEIISRSYEDVPEVDLFLDEAEKLIFDIAQRKIRNPTWSMKQIVVEAFKAIEKLYESKKLVTGVPTGYFELDRLTSGLQPSDLIVIAGRPSMGKTSLALNLASHAAVQARVPTAIFSLEMSKEQLAQRLLCSEARIDSSKLRSGQLREDAWPRLTHAAGLLSEAPLFIDDSAAITVLEMRAKARRLKKEHGLGLLIVDYLQLMRSVKSLDNREREISEISRSLKALAKDLSIPIVALSQLNRALENRTDKRPHLADLRECVTGDTSVVLADGCRVPIAELVGTAPEVVTVSADGKLRKARAEKIWSVGMRPVYAVHLASGRCVKVTAEHRLYGALDWRRVSELREGDRLALARFVPEPEQPERWPALRVALLGQLIGDGSYLKGQPLRYTTASEDNSQLVSQAAVEEFGTAAVRYRGRGKWHQLLIRGNGNRWHPAGVNKWLRDLGVFGQRSFQKRVPASVFRLANDQIALLLRHLWATDGTIYTRKAEVRGSHLIHYSTNSWGLAGDVAALLLRLGIVARIQTVQKALYRPTHMVMVMGSEFQMRFLSTVGAFGPRQRQAEVLAAALADVVPNTNVDTLPREYFDLVKDSMAVAGVSHRQMAGLRGTSYGGSAHFRFAPSRQLLHEYAGLLQDQKLLEKSSSDLFWDRVVKIELCGKEEVFDITVPGTASWLADGIVSHNSGAIEQDSDLITFIYREEVYDAETSDKGIAELIVGKQRNGPTGLVKLAFFPEYTRFDNLAYTPEEFARTKD